jgi:hypothetical protein
MAIGQSKYRAYRISVLLGIWRLITKEFKCHQKKFGQFSGQRELLEALQPRIMPRLGIIAPEFLEGSTLSRFKMNRNMTEILTTW